MKPALIYRFALALATAVFVSSCAELQTTTSNAVSAVANVVAPQPSGFWEPDGATGEPKIVVHLSEQKAYFFRGKQMIGETTVSTGKTGFSTPPGHYHVISKDRDHVSSEFGDYVDDSGNVVRSNIDARKDKRPKGTHFDGARMPYCMHFNGGYAMHEGYVPPFAASHGCIRIPKGMAEKFFDAAHEGTPITVKQ
jgi:lipoprotein-anchoring transpeptidase ErfK/SrfK